MGDPVCWLNRTCLSCGRFVEEEDFDVCPVCGWSPADPLTTGLIDEDTRQK